ncbi:SpoU methylase, putative [Bodo saltans]|uniref:SpoU methylase, putative n=1 Tax=Bodo saltans TaxID=75058 RepID=A0A0S4IV97_BODSA|nr:SpoU methylase, putative [Bodo saltans]|eukprot:CUF50567.1 SpoU methylase, putative [Bodo saltans]
MRLTIRRFSNAVTTRRIAEAARTGHTFPEGKYDFDAWAYNLHWPQKASSLPLMGKCSVAVEDIKFAFNAWMLLRLCMFYGLPHPSILSRLRHTTPSMDIAERGNRLFYMHSHVGTQSLTTGLSANKVKIALTPSHPKAVSIEHFPWAAVAQQKPGGVELVLGMENGMSEAVMDQCDHYVYIPQYGSIGSLSMLSALSIAVHHAHSHLTSPLTSPTSPIVLPSEKVAVGQQPTTSSYAPPRTRLPHDPKWEAFSNEEVRVALTDIRKSYPMKLSVLIRNEIADRNIGATVRNANVFNCDEVLLFNRKKFSMRGTVGTHHYTPIKFFDTYDDLLSSGVLDHSEVWLLQSHYPYLQNFYQPPVQTQWIEGKKGRRPVFDTFIRPHDAGLSWWAANTDVLHTPHHPMMAYCSRLLTNNNDTAEVFLDSDDSIVAALEDARQRGCKGVILACPEEGTTPHPELASLASRIAHVVRPSRLSVETQRGLSPALITASALERVRALMAFVAPK